MTHNRFVLVQAYMCYGGMVVCCTSGELIRKSCQDKILRGECVADGST